MVTAMEVADWMLAKAHAKGVSDMTNMKLNKLVYFAQAHTLAATGNSLIKEDAEAWTHGPVFVSVYRAYQASGSSPIKHLPSRVPHFDAVSEELLDRVWADYGHDSASRLRKISHDALYRRHFDGTTHCTEIIPQNEIRDSFHSGASGKSRIVSSEVDYIDDDDEQALELADSEETVRMALQLIFA